MARKNVKSKRRDVVIDWDEGERTYEGAEAEILRPALQLRRAVLSCLLWENQFYESGEDIAKRINLLGRFLAQTDAGRDYVEQLAIYARNQHNIRHAPLWLAASLMDARRMRASLVPNVVNRADEMGELVAMYWRGGKRPLPRALVRGLAATFPKFDAYQLAKYDRENSDVRVRDVMFLAHPSAGRKGYDRKARRALADGAVPNVSSIEPLNAQEQVWAKLASDTLESPDTWEVGLSTGGDKRETFERLIREGKLGALATIRNLRNMTEAGVSPELIAGRLDWIDSRAGILPFQFINAAKFAPKYEAKVEAAMLRSASGLTKLPGRTVLVIDRSGSMGGMLSEHRLGVSRNSDMTRLDAALALAILAREVCEDVAIYATAGSDSTGTAATALMPDRHGFALADTIRQYDFGRTNNGGGIFLAQTMDYITVHETEPIDRVIVFTDEQDTDRKRSPKTAQLLGTSGNYLLNVASYKHSIAFDKWTSVDGFSDAAMEFIAAIEATDFQLRGPAAMLNSEIYDGKGVNK